MNISPTVAISGCAPSRNDSSVEPENECARMKANGVFCALRSWEADGCRAVASWIGRLMRSWVKPVDAQVWRNLVRGHFARRMPQDECRKMNAAREVRGVEAPPAPPPPRTAARGTAPGAC